MDPRWLIVPVPFVKWRYRYCWRLFYALGKKKNKKTKKRQLRNFIRHLTFWLILLWGKCNLGARDLFLARFPVSVNASAYGRRCVGLRPTPKIPRRKREKPLVPRIREMWILPIMSTIWRHNDGNYVIISIRFSPGGTPYNGPYRKALPKRGTFFHASGILKGKDFIRWSA